MGYKVTNKYFRAQIIDVTNWNLGGERRKKDEMRLLFCHLFVNSQSLCAMKERMRLIIEEKPNELSPAYVQLLVDQLPAWRRDQALRYRYLGGQFDCAMSYLLLCRLLREEYGIQSQPTFVYAESGKPSLAEYPNLYFSISHCKLAVGCLLSDCPCGLDVESVRSFRSSVVSYAMNADEVFRIQSASDPAVEFIRLWTQKEAILKCKGTGIAGNLMNALDTDSLRGFELETIEKEGYIYSTATLST